MDFKSNHSQLQERINRAEKLKRLNDNPDFAFFIDILKSKQKQYYNIFRIPERIGHMVKIATQNSNGQISYEFVKYTKEDDDVRLKEAQLRYHTFEVTIQLVDDFIKDGERANKALIELNNKKEKQ